MAEHHHVEVAIGKPLHGGGGIHVRLDRVTGLRKDLVSGGEKSRILSNGQDNDATLRVP
jgi:hypothetical protein